MTKPHLHALAAIALVTASVGCGDGNSNNGNVGCTVTLTGGISASPACTSAVAAYTQATNQSAITVLTTGTTPTVAATIAFTGTLHTGTYHGTDAGAVGGIAITQGANSWSAVAGGNGSITVTLTSVSTVSSTAQGTAYLVHGTWDATVPSSAQGGTAITFHATF